MAHGSSRLRSAGAALLVALVLSSCADAPTRPGEPGSIQTTLTLDASDQEVAVLFGPRRFERATGGPQTESVTLTAAELSGFEAPFVLRVRNGAADGSGRVSSASVHLDGQAVFGPSDFNQRVAELRREIPLREGSVLRVQNAGAPGSFLEITIEGRPSLGRGSVGPNGGTVALPGLASFDFPAGLFATEQGVAITRAEDAEAMAQFVELESLFRVGARSTYQVRLLAGTAAPADGSFQAVINVPADLVIPAGHRPELFAQVFEDVGMEVLDNFQLFASEYDPVQNTLTATLPSWVLTGDRRTDGRYEALLMIGTTPGGTTQTATQRLLQPSWSVSIASGPGECKAGFIGKPVQGDYDVSSPYGERVHPIHGTKKMHWGADYAVPNGTQVVAAADGKIERVRDQGDKGYGLYLILRHTDGSASLYAHLHETTSTVGQEVKRGDPIARSNDSGGSTGPHLHFEYVPNGEIVQNKNRIDPTPCIQDKTVTGSITVRDNGSLADDAFAVYLDGIHIGTTAIGASNNFAMNNLIPGAHTLTIKGVVVPDNVGTYEILLSSGITFSDGSTRRSGTVPNQGSASFGIVVPTTTSQSISPVTLMRANAVQEAGQVQEEPVQEE